MDYYATLLQEGVSYEPVTLLLRKIQLDPAPIFNGGQGCKYPNIKVMYGLLSLTTGIYIILLTFQEIKRIFLSLTS